jgi:hypothetical protein
MAHSPSDLDPRSQELGEVRSVKNFVLHGLGTVDGEGMGDLRFSLFVLSLDLGNFNWSLFCGHRNIIFN